MTTESELELHAEMLRETERNRGVSLGRDAWRRLRRRPLAMVCLTFLILLSILSAFTPFLPLQPPNRQRLERQFSPPTLVVYDYDRLALPGDESAKDRDPTGEGFGELSIVSRWLLKARVNIFGNWSLPSLCGTDQLGRDVLSRIFWGSRVSLLVGLVATMVSLAIGVSYGAIAGYVGGRVDNVMMRIVDMLYSIPFIFVVIFIVAVLDQQKWLPIDRITVFFLIVGAIYWLTMARVVRGQVISLKEHQFVEAARTIGAGQLRIIFRHLVPNLLGVVIVYLTLTIPNVMLFEAFLSFLGLGVRPPNVSWGLLADEGIKAITPIRIYWWLVVFPSLALGLTLFALNFLGDALRDALDPRLKYQQP